MTEVGFLTDATLCIGCKACEVACKQWNQLPDDGFALSGRSYDNTTALGATTWRHVLFSEQPAAGKVAWKMLSDVCKHCERAGCLEACPTGAIVKTEHGTIYIQPEVCNGCGYCVPACPFGVVARSEDTGVAQKCTLCFDRLNGGLEPACAKACPTDSIEFGPIERLKQKARARVELLQAKGIDAHEYGIDQPGTGGLHAMFVLDDRPEAFNLPRDPVVPTKGVGRSWLMAGAAVAGLAALSLLGRLK